MKDANRLLSQFSHHQSAKCIVLLINVCFCSARFMLKKTKLVSSHSSARLLEDVVVDKDDHGHLIQSSRVRVIVSSHLNQITTEHIK